MGIQLVPKFHLGTHFGEAPLRSPTRIVDVETRAFAQEGSFEYLGSQSEFGNHGDEMRILWAIATGIICGLIQSVPFWEVFDPKQALSERRYLYLAQFASLTVVPLFAGTVAGRDFGGSHLRRALAGGGAGIVAILVWVVTLNAVPTFILPERFVVACLIVATLSVVCSIVGGATSSGFWYKNS